MGTLIGHVAPGFGFLLIGLWHLYNHTKFHSLHPTSYTSLPWFPSPLLRRLELLLIAAASALSIAMELFIGPHNHHPLDPDDWSIPSDHLHNFEHASISLSFLLYATIAAFFDILRRPPPASYGLTQLLAATSFAMQLLMFHLHSTDHMGVEGQYHWLLQLVVALSLTTTLIGITAPASFINSFIRSTSITLQGVWFMVMGFVLWTPRLVFKGCFMNLEDGHYVVRCRDEAALYRAKSLVNLQFSWVVTGVIVFSAMMYVYLTGLYPEEDKYVSLGAAGCGGSSDDEEEDDLEGQKRMRESIELER